MSSSRKPERSPWSFALNIVAGDYSPLARMRRIVENLGRRTPMQSCCGNYGEPGC